MLGSSEEDKENKQCLVSSKTSLHSEYECSCDRFTTSLVAIFLGNCEIFISSSILGHGVALLECTLETKPLERNADYAVSLKVEPVEMIYDSVSYIEMCPQSFEVFPLLFAVLYFVWKLKPVLIKVTVLVVHAC